MAASVQPWEHLADPTQHACAAEIARLQAHIETPEGLAADWLFRQLDGRWMLSEPTVEQVGAAQIVEHEHFNFKTYTWADDVNDEVIERMENARLRVQERLGKLPGQKIEVQILPIYGLTPGMSPGAVAFYDAGDPDRIVIYAPQSFLFGLYDPQNGWESDLEDGLTHEATHWVHTRSFDDAGKLADWMSEGLAEYVSNSTSIYLAFEAARLVKEAGGAPGASAGGAEGAIGRSQVIANLGVAGEGQFDLRVQLVVEGARQSGPSVVVPAVTLRRGAARGVCAWEKQR